MYVLVQNTILSLFSLSLQTQRINYNYSTVLFFSKIPLEETVSELRKELEQCLISNKAKREQVHQLEIDLGTLRDQLKDQEMKAQRMEQIAQEHEVGFFS